MQARFEAVREAVIASPRDPQALYEEIAAMRAKVRTAHRDKEGLFDVKHSAGGMVDIEFAVQFLVLAHSADQPFLRANVGNIALLQRARLNEEATEAPVDAVAQERAAGLALWEAVFGQS